MSYRSKIPSEADFHSINIHPTVIIITTSYFISLKKQEMDVIK